MTRRRERGPEDKDDLKNRTRAKKDQREKEEREKERGKRKE